jgi:hypothetical protein
MGNRLHSSHANWSWKRFMDFLGLIMPLEPDFPEMA